MGLTPEQDLERRRALAAMIEWQAALAESTGATALVLEVHTPSGYCQMIGTFPIDTVEVFETIERLRGEEDAGDDPNVYCVRSLFPVSSTKVPR